MPGFENPHEQANETKTLERPAETLTVSLEIELDGEFAADLSVPQGEIDAALESGTVSLEIELDGEFAADLSVPQGEIDAALESGVGYPARGELSGLADPDNYQHVVLDALETTLEVGALDPNRDLASQIEADLANSITISRLASTPDPDAESTVARDVYDGITAAESATYGFDDLEGDSELTRPALETWLEDDLRAVTAHVKTETDTIEKPRVDFLQTPSPFRALTDEVEAV
ncbi:hypothetical protein C493_02296, partial [Natronolimnohabitans innermongolicus JCM 12255]